MTASLAGHKFASPRDAYLHTLALSLHRACDRRIGGSPGSPVGEFAVLHIGSEEAPSLAAKNGMPAAVASELVGSWVITETIKLREDGSILIPATVFVGAFDRPHKADDEFDRLSSKYQQWLKTEAIKAAISAERVEAGDCSNCGAMVVLAELQHNGGICDSCS